MEASENPQSDGQEQAPPPPSTPGIGQPETKGGPNGEPLESAAGSNAAFPPPPPAIPGIGLPETRGGS
ncbi:MAG: hypothetical protein HYX29_07695 [Solirubrobacterales bacterium]|nr:hypothetical protein [Solirubrobacterales bacterium]